MSNKDKYRALCAEADLPLFLQYEWIEGVCAGKDWDVALVENGEQILAAMPYEYRTFLWTRNVVQPEMCPYFGLWINPQIADDKTKVAEVLTNIDDQLRANRIRSVYQRLMPDSVAGATLTGLGYKSTTRWTYVLDTTAADVETIREGFSRNKRRKLDTLTSGFHVADVDPEDFYRFHATTNAQKNKRLWYTREMLLVIYAKSCGNGKGRLLGVYDAENHLLAAALLVWDNHTVYQLLNTFDHDYPDNGARELLTLESVKIAHDGGKQLDFTFHRDYLKHYGAKRHIYFSVHKGAAFRRWLQRIKDWIEF